MVKRQLQIIAAYFALIVGVGLPANMPAPRGITKQVTATNLKFDFGAGKVAPGYIKVLQTTTYSKELGYGFEPDSKVSCVDRGGGDALRSDLCTSDQPFFFTVG